LVTKRRRGTSAQGTYYSHFYKTQLRPTLKRIDAYAVVVPLFQQIRERYKIDSTFIPGGRDASAFSTIGPVICTS
jgi:hypothetical protein